MHISICYYGFLDPNTFVQTLCDDEKVWKNTINYFDDIIIWNINNYNTCNSITQYSHEYIHPCIIGLLHQIKIHLHYKYVFSFINWNKIIIITIKMLIHMTWSTKVVVCLYHIHLNKKEISITKVIGYRLSSELPNHLIDYNFTYILLSNSWTWVHKHEINEINQNGMLKVAMFFFWAKVIKKMVKMC